MDFVYSETIYSILREVGFLPLLFVVYIFSMFLFWYECVGVRKNVNSVFDQWFVSSLIMILWGRLAYVVTYWDEFFGGYWFWLPYEKYADAIHIFRAMPWKTFRFWDGGFLFIAMFFAYLLTNYIFTVWLKRWRWKEMVGPVLISANSMLAATLYIYGIFLRSSVIAQFGAYLCILVLAYTLIVNLIRFRYRYQNGIKMFLVRIVTLIFQIVSTGMVSYIFLSQNITHIDRLHVYALIALSVYLSIVFLYDIKKGDTPPVDIMPPVKLKQNIVLNQAIKIK